MRIVHRYLVTSCAAACIAVAIGCGSSSTSPGPSSGGVQFGSCTNPQGCPNGTTGIFITVAGSSSWSYTFESLPVSGTGARDVHFINIPAGSHDVAGQIGQGLSISVHSVAFNQTVEGVVLGSIQSVEGPNPNIQPCAIAYLVPAGSMVPFRFRFTTVAGGGVKTQAGNC